VQHGKGWSDLQVVAVPDIIFEEEDAV
jgi:hypothetical protein